MIKRIKNTTADVIKKLGILFLPGEYVNVEPQFYMQMSISYLDFEEEIANGDIIVNDGISDLSAINGLKYLKCVGNTKEFASENSNDGYYKTLREELDSISNGQVSIQDEGNDVDNTPHSKINFTGSGVDVQDAGNGTVAVTISGSASVYGSQHNEASNESESQTTNNVYKEKLKMILTSLPSGRYRVGWFFEIKISSASSSVNVKVELDDADILTESTDSFKQLGFQPISGMCHLDLMGSHEIDIDFCPNDVGKTATIRRARLEIWRVE